VPVVDDLHALPDASLAGRRQAARVLRHRHVVLGDDHEGEVHPVKRPEVLPSEVAAVDHHRRDARRRAQVLLRLAHQREQPLPLIVLDFAHRHGQGQPRAHINEHAHLPAEERFHDPHAPLGLRLRGRPRHAQTAAPWVRRWRKDLAPVERHRQVTLEQSPRHEQAHRAVEQRRQLFHAQRADVRGQALRRERAALGAPAAPRVPPSGQTVLDLVRIEANQPHQRHVAEQKRR